MTGQLLANGLSESMIRDELAVEGIHEEDEDFWNFRREMGLYADYVSGEEIAETYDISFSLTYVLTFMGLGLASILLASLLPLWYLLTLKPRKMLMG